MIFTRVVSDKLSERAGASVPRLEWHRARQLPALGMPVRQRRRRLATGVSIVLHVLMIWALLRPAPLTGLDPDLQKIETGGGGPGPVGGGGGGTRGTGGVKYVQVSPPPTPAPTPPQVAPVLPPVEPVVEPPKPVIAEPVVPVLELPKLATHDPKAEVKVESPVIGAGGGTGNDGTRGNGPGTGGGVGSGVGTGRGSGIGPGTGGGNLDYYPPSPIEMLLPPLPAPSKVRGSKVLAHFFVAASGKLDSVVFVPTRDGGYNRQLKDILQKYRFRAATTLEGKPIPGIFQYEFIL